MKLTNLQALEMLTGLRQLEAREILKLAAATRWKLTGNLRKLSPIGEDFEIAKKISIKLYKPDDPQGDRPGYENDMAKLLKEEVELPLSEIRLAELDLDKNSVSVTTLAALGEMVKE